MAQRFGFPLNGVKELKLGKTFTKGYKDEAYHTIRYDFKPASVDSQNAGFVEVVDKEVTLNVPLTGGAGAAQEAVFKGNRTPASKDCLLVIDHSTEGSNRKAMPKGKSLQDAPHNKPSPSQNHSSGSPHVARPSPSHRSPPSSKSPSRSSTVKSHSTTSTPGSMPMLNFEEERKSSIMSDSSSDSDSNSSSSSCDSDSDSDTEMQDSQQNASVAAAPSQNYTANGHGPKNGFAVSHKTSPTSILSDLELSEED
ncbi:Ell-associated factor Eaf [Armadillidium nasatum]|uniref:Ell-associated factor Eaf n=1 Tax=Armadillidium nasatum TaxID=96803 RepID=A0A5N5TMC3_9CRUS|nr:Ell-associated factor Eaf [Armadillidium nasatum]